MTVPVGCGCGVSLCVRYGWRFLVGVACDSVSSPAAAWRLSFVLRSLVLTRAVCLLRILRVLFCGVAFCCARRGAARLFACRLCAAARLCVCLLLFVLFDGYCVVCVS